MQICGRRSDCACSQQIAFPSFATTPSPYGRPPARSTVDGGTLWKSSTSRGLKSWKMTREWSDRNILLLSYRTIFPVIHYHNTPTKSLGEGGSEVDFSQTSVLQCSLHVITVIEHQSPMRSGCYGNGLTDWIMWHCVTHKDTGSIFGQRTIYYAESFWSSSVFFFYLNIGVTVPLWSENFAILKVWEIGGRLLKCKKK